MQLITIHYIYMLCFIVILQNYSFFPCTVMYIIDQSKEVCQQQASISTNFNAAMQNVLLGNKMAAEP